MRGIAWGGRIVVVKDADAIGGPIAVQTDMEQTVHVTVRPR